LEAAIDHSVKRCVILRMNDSGPAPSPDNFFDGVYTGTVDGNGNIWAPEGVYTTIGELISKEQQMGDLPQHEPIGELMERAHRKHAEAQATAQLVYVPAATRVVNFAPVIAPSLFTPDHHPNPAPLSTPTPTLPVSAPSQAAPMPAPKMPTLGSSAHPILIPDSDKVSGLPNAPLERAPERPASPQRKDVPVKERLAYLRTCSVCRSESLAYRWLSSFMKASTKRQKEYANRWWPTNEQALVDVEWVWQAFWEFEEAFLERNWVEARKKHPNRDEKPLDWETDGPAIEAEWRRRRDEKRRQLNAELYGVAEPERRRKRQEKKTSPTGDGAEEATETASSSRKRKAPSEEIPKANSSKKRKGATPVKEPVVEPEEEEEEPVIEDDEDYEFSAAIEAGLDAVWNGEESEEDGEKGGGGGEEEEEEETDEVTAALTAEFFASFEDEE